MTKMNRILLALLLTAFLSFCTQGDTFNYLKFQDHSLQSTHGVPFELKVPESYQQAGPVNHEPTFNNHPFKVSLAAFIGDSTFIMVHAETLADQSGILDYSNFKSVTFKGFPFNTRAQCAEFTEKIIQEEHDVKFLYDNSFNPMPAVYLKQLLTTSPDGNAEFVLSYGKRVPNCSDRVISVPFKALIEREMDAQISLRKL
jgi:hypothetical protein